MTTLRKIELLCPAKNVECGREAILHGADAVYMGAPKFGARVAAGNSLEDIAELVGFAHGYRVRVYVTLNVILYDHELMEVERLVHNLWEIGVDALIVQDMGITKLNLPPIPLHVSTQADNRTFKDVRFLQEAGFSRVVLARELSLEQIKAISDATTVSLECFIHGALCVSYSGQCYLSQAMYGRSANRGECAQCCRLPYTLVDAQGRLLAKRKHLLSIKDLNRTVYLEELINVGVDSFKVEGRLKDVSYVKNVTAWYRRRLDEIIERRGDLARASSGCSKIYFVPNVYKSFNRGFTDYFMNDRPLNLGNPDTPKSLGEFVGCVDRMNEDSFTVVGSTVFSNGDGLSFFDKVGNFEGFRVNKVESNRLFPAMRVKIAPGTPLHRTFDQVFERQLERPTAKRVVPVVIRCWETSFGFALSMEDDESHRVMRTFAQKKTLAQKPQKKHVESQLSRLGNTFYEAILCEVMWDNEWFVPVSEWVEQKRLLCCGLDVVRALNYRREERRMVSTNHPYPQGNLSYLGNVSNQKAREFYGEHGVQKIEPAFEIQFGKGKTFTFGESVVLMFCKHCLRYELGACPKQGGNSVVLKEPLFLVYNKRRIMLRFDCKACEMHVLFSGKADA